MLQCLDCKSFFSSKNLFLDHLKHSHKFCNSYKCGFPKCFRSYTLLRYLKKHIDKHPDIQDEVNCRPICSASKALPKFSNTQLGINSSTCLPNFGNTSACLNANASDNMTQFFPENNTNTTVDVRTEIFNNCQIFVSQLYSNSSVTRSAVQQVVEGTENLFESISEILKKNIFEILKKYEISENDKNYVHKLLAVLQKPFENLNTEHFRLKSLEESTYYIRPSSFIICEMRGPVRVASRVQHDIVKCEAQFISLRQVLKNFLELPNVYNSIIEFMAEAAKDKYNISSVLQGQIWKNVCDLFTDRIVLPLYIFFDEFETGNPLGSKAGIHKLGGLYCSLACLPPSYASLLENIFLFQIYETNFKKFFTLQEIFSRVISELKFLEKSGIEISIEVQGKKTKIRVYFVLVALIGDNLGLNYITGFNESFVAHHFCRICQADNILCSKLVCESPELLRNAENYHLDLNESANGVKTECVWNQLDFFKNTTNFSCDIMHDLLEGVCRYDMGIIINTLICVKGYFSMDILNTKISYFNHQYHSDAGNKIPEIKVEQIKKSFLIVSASEMYSLVIYFGLIIGDLVPEDDEIWNFYLLLYELLEISFGHLFNDNVILYLRQVIKEHNILYMDLFKQHLKPKYHFLIHYPTIITLLGPPRYYSAIRFEAFHKISKIAAHNVTSRINIAHTIAIKHQLKLCNRFISRIGFNKEKFEYGSIVVQKSDFRPLSAIPEDCVEVKWLKYFNIMYKKNNVILLCLQEDERPVFGQICHIFVNNLNVYFIINKIVTYGYVRHFQSYKLELSNILQYQKLAFKDLFSVFPNNIHIIQDGSAFISTFNIKTDL